MNRKADDRMARQLTALLLKTRPGKTEVKERKQTRMKTMTTTCQ
jgi:hypothetical protein